MNSSLQNALEDLRSIGDGDELRWSVPKMADLGWVRNNSHVHLPPNFSAFETVDQAVALAADQGVGVVGLSNYYDFEVYGDFYVLARPKRIFPLFGLEVICLIDELARAGIKINDPGNPGKMYICGKGITRIAEPPAPAKELLATIRRNDRTRMVAMIDRLADVFVRHGVRTGLTEDQVIAQVCRRHGCPSARVTLQERHVAKAFQEALFSLVPDGQRRTRLSEIFGAESKGADDPVKVQNEIRSHLMKAGKPGFVEESFINFEQAYALILALGGIPCYPTLVDGADPVCPYEEPVEHLIAELQRRHIYFAEYIPIRNHPAVLSHYVTAVRKAGIPVAGGTEHNTLDLLALDPTCRNQAPVPPEIRAIFWEGACVAAAHQFLTLHGQCGFVDNTGALNPAYPSDEARIEAFAQLGAAVIKRYQKP